jgi:hypothetical protein
MFKSVTSLATGQETVVEMTAEEVAELEAINITHLESLTYAQKRQAEYPPITDYIDGVVKDDQAQIAKYVADCLAVKTKYPKD